jgi:probable HAF family extracellular repeat protein
MLRLARRWLWLSIIAATVTVHTSAQNTTVHAFLWSSTAGIQDLGSLGGGSSYANGINNAGQVVGYYATPEGAYRAFLWTASGGIQDLGTLGGDFAIASGINSAGQVVGGASTASGEVQAFLWTATSGMQDLGTLAARPAAQLPSMIWAMLPAARHKLEISALWHFAKPQPKRCMDWAHWATDTAMDTPSMPQQRSSEVLR